MIHMILFLFLLQLPPTSVPVIVREYREHLLM